MSSRKRYIAAFLAAVLSTIVLPAIEAKAATTYEVGVGADFFGQGIPGFSLKIYPSSISLHKGDVIHFSGFGVPFLLGEGVHPDVWLEDNNRAMGQPYFDVVADPDEGANALKFNSAFETPTHDCSDVANPCAWDGTGEVLNAGFVEEGWVAITANQGSLIYGLTADDAYVRIEVVGNNETASTQTELDDRAAKMRLNDYNNLAAMHFKLSSKKSFHYTPGGAKVWDAFAGFDLGPTGLDAMYPKKMSIKKGEKVQWHFNYVFNSHTVTMPFDKGRDITRSYNPPSDFGPVCDPDGDNGTAPDTPPVGEDPPCADMTQFEFDINPAEAYAAGNGTFTGAADFEHSGVKGNDFLQPGFFNEDPFTVKFKNKSSAKGYRYLCTIHGPFMSGRVVVK